MYYGFDIGGTKIEFAAFNLKLERVASKRMPTPKDDYKKLLEEIVTTVEQYDQEFGQKGMVGIGIPGIEHVVDGLLETSNIPAANGKSLRADLEAKLDRRVLIENDANCFALSEAWDDEHQGQEIILGLILGTGFGGGVIVNGHVVSGQNHVGGEIGHTRLPIDAWFHLGDNPPLFECGCGKKGCLDNYLSGRGFELLYEHEYGERLKAIEIIENFYAQKEPAVEFVDKFTELLAICLANLLTAFDANTLVFGGGLSNFDYLYEVLPQKIKPYLMRVANPPKIFKAKYGDSGGVRGAAFLNLPGY